MTNHSTTTQTPTTTAAAAAKPSKRAKRTRAAAPVKEVPVTERYGVLTQTSLVNVAARLAATQAFTPDSVAQIADVARRFLTGSGPSWLRVDAYLTDTSHPTCEGDRWATVRILELLANSPHPARRRPVPPSTTKTPRELTMLERSLVRFVALTYPYMLPVVAGLDAGINSATLVAVYPDDVIIHAGDAVGVTIHTATGPVDFFWGGWATDVMTTVVRHCHRGRPLLAEASKATDARRLQSTLLMRARLAYRLAGLDHDPQVKPSSLLLPS